MWHKGCKYLEQNASHRKRSVRQSLLHCSNVGWLRFLSAIVQGFSEHSIPVSTSADQTSPLVSLRDVRFAYGEREILRGIDLSVHRGQVVAIMGGSGCGKTTLLRLIGGQLRASGGTVEVEGRNVARLTGKELYALRRRMGMLFQFGALFTDMSVFDNVAFPLREHTLLSESMIRDIVLMKLHAVGLRGARDLMPGEISGGMARRVALARAIALDPESFRTLLKEGPLMDRGMPRFEAMTDEQIHQMWSYIRARAREALGTRKPSNDKPAPVRL